MHDVMRHAELARSVVHDHATLYYVIDIYIGLMISCYAVKVLVIITSYLIILFYY